MPLLGCSASTVNATVDCLPTCRIALFSGCCCLLQPHAVLTELLDLLGLRRSAEQASTSTCGTSSSNCARRHEAATSSDTTHPSAPAAVRASLHLLSAYISFVLAAVAGICMLGKLSELIKGDWPANCRSCMQRLHLLIPCCCNLLVAIVAIAWFRSVICHQNRVQARHVITGVTESVLTTLCCCPACCLRLCCCCCCPWCCSSPPCPSVLHLCCWCSCCCRPVTLQAAL